MSIKRLGMSALVFGALVIGSAPAARSQIVVNGGAPNEGIGWNIFDDNRASTSFSIGSTINFDAIRFWGLLPDGPTYTPDIYWQILNDDSGTPGTTIAASGHAVTSAVVRTELSAFPGFFSWQFDLGTGPQSLSAGTYWLALHDGPLDPTLVSGSSLIWETSDPPGAYAIQTFSIDDHWDVNTDSRLAFELRGATVATPEPATLSTVAAGLVALGLVRRRRRV